MRHIVQRCIARWWRIVSEHDTEPVQLVLVLLVAGWGIVWLMPGSDFSNSPTFAALSRYVPEDPLAFATAVLGGIWLTGILSGIRSVCRWCSFLSFVFWTIVSTTTAIASPHTYAWFVFATTAIMSAWVYLRRGGEEWTQR